MGVDNYIYLVFDKEPVEVEDFIRGNFRTEFQNMRWDDDFIEVFRSKGLLSRDFELVTDGLVSFEPLRTSEEGTVNEADFRIYSVKGYTILELHPTLRKRWWYVLSSELVRLLKKFMRAGPLLICGYRDDAYLTKLGFKHDNRLILVNWLPEAIKGGKLEILPSGLTVVKNNLLPLEDGLYELVERPGREEKEYVLVKSLEGYKILVSVR